MSDNYAVLKLYPFYIDTTDVGTLTEEQMATARHRIANNFGIRAGFSPIAYILILLSLTIMTDNGWNYFVQFWYLDIVFLILTIGRLLLIKKLAHAESHNYQQDLNRYYALSLSSGLLWGLILTMMLWFDGMQNFSYLMLSLNVATTGGAIGTMSSYVRAVTQFIAITWLPMIIALVMLLIAGNSDAPLILFIVPLMLVFVFSLARRVALENQNSFLRQIQLESRTHELAFALQTIEKQQQEVKQHRDHLQELVDEQTIDLIKAKEAAEQADKSKSEFLANMSHELRTPLHAILSFSHFGLSRMESVGKDKLRDYFKKINHSGEMQLSLVNDLLDLSRLEFKKESLFFHHYNLVELTRNVIEELSGLYEVKKISMKLDNPEEVIIINCDESKIKQLLRNLLGNAIKFSPEQSQIFIRIYNNNNARLEIEDQGPGVADEEKKLIFDKFSQSSRTRTGAGGTGLGLAICAQIMHLHKGDLWVEDPLINDRDRGALFVVVFPALNP